LELIDVNVLFNQLVYNPGAFGFTNSSGYALDPSTGGGDTDQNHYVFFDGFHPTTPVHYLAAEFFYQAITQGYAFPAGRLAFRP
jgi:outer membrane lipase/esterase